jgi:ribose 5-phosphate isomerase B
MKIAVANDHAGTELKNFLIKKLKKDGFKVTDFGTNSEQAVDYPDYAQIVAKEVQKKTFEFGILICGSGIGMSIAANKIEGIRAALVYDLYTAEHAKKHNNANIITFGSRNLKNEDAYIFIKKYLKTDFELRHNNRLKKIEKI